MPWLWAVATAQLPLGSELPVPHRQEELKPNLLLLELLWDQESDKISAHQY